MTNKKNVSHSGQVFWVVMGSLSSFSLAIVSAAILSHYFDKDEYGTYRQILYIYNTLLVIFAAGLPRVFSYFLPHFNLEQGKDVVVKISKALFLAGVMFSVFLFLCSGVIADMLKNPELSTGLKWFSPVPMLLLPTMGIEGIFSSYQKTIYIAIYNTVTRFLMLFFIVAPVIWLGGSYLYAIYGWIVISFISLILAYYFIKIPFKGIKAEKANLPLTAVLAYSLPLVLASLASIAIRAADQFYISRFFGAEVFAEFSNGFIALPFVTMVTGAISTVLMPIFSRQIYEKSENADVVRLWRSAMSKSALLIYPMASFFIFQANTIIDILFSRTYENSVVYFQIAMVTSFFDIIVFAPLLLAMGKTKVYSRLHICFAFLSWALGYTVVLLFHEPVAVAILSVFLRIMLIMTFLKYVSRILNLEFFELIPIKKIRALLFHTLLISSISKVCIVNLLPNVNSIFSLIITFVAYVILLLLSARFFNNDYLQVLQPLKVKLVEYKSFF